MLNGWEKFFGQSRRIFFFFFAIHDMHSVAMQHCHVMSVKASWVPLLIRYKSIFFFLVQIIYVLITQIAHIKLRQRPRDIYKVEKTFIGEECFTIWLFFIIVANSSVIKCLQPILKAASKWATDKHVVFFWNSYPDGVFCISCCYCPTRIVPVDNPSDSCLSCVCVFLFRWIYVLVEFIDELVACLFAQQQYMRVFVCVENQFTEERECDGLIEKNVYNRKEFIILSLPGNNPDHNYMCRNLC